MWWARYIIDLMPIFTVKKWKVDDRFKVNSYEEMTKTKNFEIKPEGKGAN